MDTNPKQPTTLQAFPSITEDEFQQACRALEDRSSDKLDGTDWLGVRWTGKELIVKQKRAVHSPEHETTDEDEDVARLAEDSCAAEVVCISAHNPRPY